MEVNLGQSAPFSLHVEEEFQVVSAESYDLVSRYDEFAAADERVAVARRADGQIGLTTAAWDILAPRDAFAGVFSGPPCVPR